MTITILMMMTMDIEIWFDSIIEDEELEYPLLPSTDNIWTE